MKYTTIVSLKIANNSQLSFFLSPIKLSELNRGEYPEIYKFEISTPVPKAYPTQKVSQLRNITGLFNFDKVMEKLLAELMISVWQPEGCVNTTLLDQYVA